MKALIFISLLLAPLLALGSTQPSQRLHSKSSLTSRLRSPWEVGYAPVDGVRIWYGAWGKGQPVILLEGGMNTADEWASLVGVLVQHRYRAIALDRRCQGRSTCSTATLHYHLFAEDVIGTMDHLGIRRAAIVGFSDGAEVGLDIAMHYPDRVTRVFAFGADSSVAASIPNPKPDAIMDSGSFARGSARQEALYRAESPTPGGWAQLNARISKLWATEPHYTRAQLRAIRVPVWIADGDHEQYIERSDTDMMARTIPGASELILPHASHFAMVEEPVLFNQAVLTFLSGR